jgi:hypothetical protein
MNVTIKAQCIPDAASSSTEWLRDWQADCTAFMDEAVGEQDKDNAAALLPSRSPQPDARPRRLLFRL